MRLLGVIHHQTSASKDASRLGASKSIQWSGSSPAKSQSEYTFTIGEEEPGRTLNKSIAKPVLPETATDGMYSPTSKEHWIQEFTSQAFEGLQKGIIAYGTLRGHETRFSRIRPNNTAPMRAEVWTKTIDLRTLPEPPDIRKIMYVVWDLKEESVQTDSEDQSALDALRLHKRNGNLTPSP